VRSRTIIRVRLWSRSDLYLTVTSELVSLVPGTLVVEVHRDSSTLYLHVLNQTDPEGLARAERDALAAERRVIAALRDGRPYPTAAEGTPRS
jgi:multicomponent Na+:H+ antiporter subunit E